MRTVCRSEMDSNRRSRSFLAKAAASCQFRFSVNADRRVPNRTGERLASDSDQSDVYVCPAKERAGMKRNPLQSGTRGVADELAELRGLDLTALKQHWRVLYRTEAPVHIGRALLLQAVAYRLQERVRAGRRRQPRPGITNRGARG